MSIFKLIFIILKIKILYPFFNIKIIFLIFFFKPFAYWLVTPKFFFHLHLLFCPLISPSRSLPLSSHDDYFHKIHAPPPLSSLWPSFPHFSYLLLFFSLSLSHIHIFYPFLLPHVKFRLQRPHHHQHYRWSIFLIWWRKLK